MWKSRLKLFPTNNLSYLTCRLNHESSSISEYTAKAEYPPIYDMSYKGRKLREITSRYQKITSLPTVEQKLLELNIPKYYGFWSSQLKDNQPPLCAGDFIQYATRTHLNTNLPENYYEDVYEEATKLLPDVLDHFEYLIDLHINSTINRSKKYKVCPKEELSSGIILALNSYLCSVMSDTTAHLADAQVDIQPRIEAFWFLGGIEWTDYSKKRFKKVTEELDYDTRAVQSYASPDLRVRVSDGLPEVLSREESKAFADNIPICRLDPRNYQVYPKTQHARIMPGFWSGVEKEHSQLFYHTRRFVTDMQNTYGHTYDADTIIQRKLTVAGFSQALAQATNLGFGPVTELEYPIVHQSVVTDGKKISLCVYQLNTTQLYLEHSYTNPHSNILWVTPEADLYDRIEDGKVMGLNEKLMTDLISMYLKKPMPRSDPTPHLAPYRHLCNFPASEEYRNEFLEVVHYMMASSRRRNLVKPSIPLWEYIYKIKFKSRPMDAKLKWFESKIANNPRDIEPSRRRLDQYKPVYVRKKYRQHWENKKLKHKPRIHSENLFKYDKQVLNRAVMREHKDWLE